MILFSTYPLGLVDLKTSVVLSPDTVSLWHETYRVTRTHETVTMTHETHCVTMTTKHTVSLWHTPNTAPYEYDTTHRVTMTHETLRVTVSLWHTSCHYDTHYITMTQCTHYHYAHSTNCHYDTRHTLFPSNTPYQYETLRHTGPCQWHDGPVTLYPNTG